MVLSFILGTGLPVHTMTVSDSLGVSLDKRYAWVCFDVNGSEPCTRVELSGALTREFRRENVPGVRHADIHDTYVRDNGGKPLVQL